VRALGQWLALGTLVGLVCGIASAAFLWLLDQATEWRTGHETIVYALPVAGLTLGWIAERFGQEIKAGNNLVIDTIHDDGPEIPLRMAPLVLLGTVLTHLFGGSAGREGTAVQMGASLTDWTSHRRGLGRPLRRQLLAAGVAGGFGRLLGTGTERLAWVGEPGGIPCTPGRDRWWQTSRRSGVLAGRSAAGKGGHGRGGGQDSLQVLHDCA
jgi:H+/Cl- antiporter ClcA